MIRFVGMVFDRVRADKGLRRAQDRIDSACIEQMKPYVPISKVGGYTKASPHVWVKFTGRGKMSQAHKAEKPGIIINTEPKARKEYYINKGGSGGLRGKLWFERMKADHKRDILKAAQEEL